MSGRGAPFPLINPAQRVAIDTHNSIIGQRMPIAGIVVLRSHTPLPPELSNAFRLYSLPLTFRAPLPSG